MRCFSRAIVAAALTISFTVGAETRLALVGLTTSADLTWLGLEVVQALTEGAEANGQTVLNPEVVKMVLGDRGLQQLRDCGEDPRCAAPHLRRLFADRAVVGTLEREHNLYVLRLTLFDVATQRVLTTLERSVLIASRRFLTDVRSAVPRFVKGEKEALGTLQLTSNAGAARIRIQGVDRGVLPLTIQLKPGRYEVRVEKEGFFPGSRWVTVEPHTVTSESIRLIADAATLPPLTESELLR